MKLLTETAEHAGEQKWTRPSTTRDVRAHTGANRTSIVEHNRANIADLDPGTVKGTIADCGVNILNRYMTK